MLASSVTRVSASRMAPALPILARRTFSTVRLNKKITSESVLPTTRAQITHTDAGTAYKSFHVKKTAAIRSLLDLPKVVDHARKFLRMKP
mmetsp:Transcript_20441/g.28522  ORF Transcript_20441/g.28522 Transcript_20441/m.28522 type:complete len:90 (+) Transcript_20441:280-549(+)